MTYRLATLFVVVPALGLAGCSSDDGGAKCDPLRDALCTVNNNTDSSVNSRRDSSVNNQGDATVNNRRDATINQPDGTIHQPDGTIHQPDGTINQPDATLQPDATVDGGACGQIEPKPSGPAACTASTRACIDACGDATCVNNCLQATTGCAECVREVGRFCPARNGCETETTNILCCLEQDCANAQDVAACVSSMCPAAGNAYNTCVNTNTITQACLNVFSAEYAVCFQDAPDASVPDASVGDAGVRECAQPLSPVPDNVHTFCESTTRSCVAGASTEQEYDNCLAADNAAPYVSGTTTLDCGWCLGYTQSSCGSNNGCGDEFGDYFCCIEDNGCTDATCASTKCGTEASAVNTCFGSVSGTCGDFNNAVYDPCF